MSRTSKLATILAAPLGLVYGGVPIYMEETCRWATLDSLTYFALTIPVLSVVWYLMWPMTKLEPRDQKA